VLHGHILDVGGAALTSQLMSSSHFTKCNRNSGCPMKGGQAFCKMAKFSHTYLPCYTYRKENLKGWCEDGNEWPAADAVTLNAELSACPEDKRLLL